MRVDTLLRHFKNSRREGIRLSVARYYPCAVEHSEGTEFGWTTKLRIPHGFASK
jgi:hypothetical protein